MKTHSLVILTYVLVAVMGVMGAMLWATADMSQKQAKEIAKLKSDVRTAMGKYYDLHEKCLMD